jgi:hypothetical protein
MLCGYLHVCQIKLLNFFKNWINSIIIQEITIPRVGGFIYVIKTTFIYMNFSFDFLGLDNVYF